MAASSSRSDSDSDFELDYLIANAPDDNLALPGSQAADSSGASVLAKVRTQTGPPQMEPTLSDFMNAKIEMTMREEEDEERQQAMGSDSAYPSPSSSGTTRLPGQGSGSSSRSCGEVASSAHEGAVSSTAASSEAADQEGEGGVGGGGGRVEPAHSSSSSSHQPSPDAAPAAGFVGRGVGGGAVSTTGADTPSPLASSSSTSSSSSAARAMSPSVGSSQSAPVTKKRIMHRPRFRGDDPPATPEKFGGGGGYASTSTTAAAATSSSSRDHPHPSSSSSSSSKAAGSPADNAGGRGGPPSKPPPPPPSSSSGGGVGSGSGPGGKEKKSDLYDFPDDSPDEDCGSRPPSSYMALGTPGKRSPRKGHVDSSDSAKPHPQTEPPAAVGSSLDDRQVLPPSKDSNEAQGYESYASSSSHHHGDRHYSRREDAGSASTVDSSTLADKSSSSSDDSATIDSSTPSDRKAPKRVSPRRVADDAGEGFEPSESTAGISGLEPVSFSQHARSPRARVPSTEAGSGFDGVDSSSSERSPGGGTAGMGMVSYPPYANPGSGQAVVSSIMREPDHQTVCSRDQEPAPLLSSQYETLSDDEDN